MDIIKYRYISNSSIYYSECVCGMCKSIPAVELVADCGGDSIGFCKECWKTYFEKHIMSKFDEKENLQEVSNEELPEKYKLWNIKFFKYIK